MTQEKLDMVQEVVRQFGGAGAFFMIGAKKRVCGEDSNGDVWLQFNLMRNGTGANWCRITLNLAADTYTVEFKKVPREPSVQKMIQMSCDEYAAAVRPRVLRKFEGLYCDMLRETFERETGLYLTVPRVVGINA